MTLDLLAMARVKEGRIAIERAVVLGLLKIAGEQRRPELAMRLGRLDALLSNAERATLTIEFRQRRGAAALTPADVLSVAP